MRSARERPSPNLDPGARAHASPASRSASASVLELGNTSSTAQRVTMQIQDGTAESARRLHELHLLARAEYAQAGLRHHDLRGGGVDVGRHVHGHAGHDGAGRERVRIPVAAVRYGDALQDDRAHAGHGMLRARIVEIQPPAPAPAPLVAALSPKMSPPASTFAARSETRRAPPERDGRRWTVTFDDSRTPASDTALPLVCRHSGS